VILIANIVKILRLIVWIVLIHIHFYKLAQEITVVSVLVQAIIFRIQQQMILVCNAIQIAWNVQLSQQIVHLVIQHFIFLTIYVTIHVQLKCTLMIQHKNATFAITIAQFALILQIIVVSVI
jgi:hypothetical protein